MVLFIGVSIAVLVGFVYSALFESKYSIICIGITLFGFILHWSSIEFVCDFESIRGAAVGIWSIGFLGMIIYHQNEVSQSFNRRALIIALGAVGSGTLMFKVMHYPLTGIGMLVSIVPVIFLIKMITDKKIKRSQMLSPYIVFGSICLLNFLWIAHFWVT